MDTLSKATRVLSRKTRNGIIENRQSIVMSSMLMAFYYLASYYFIIADMYVRFTIYWVILGVMATIGLGTGVYTGTFYLFPYILAIKDTAERCGHLDFSLLTMECGETIANEVPPHQIEILIKTLPPLYLWSFGTSLGELPPYYLGKHSKKLEIIENSRFTGWFRKYSVATITALAVWPNCTFDMCGLTAGYLGVPLWKYITASFVGKGLIKGTIEAYGVLYLLNENTLKEHSNEFNSLFYVVMAGCLWQIARELAKQYDEQEEKKEIVK